MSAILAVNKAVTIALIAEPVATHTCDSCRAPTFICSACGSPLPHPAYGVGATSTWREDAHRDDCSWVVALRALMDERDRVWREYSA
jgi:hypothetical protein